MDARRANPTVGYPFMGRGRYERVVPLTSLHPAVVGVLEKLGIQELTSPQEEAIPHVLEGRNILLVAPTGLGKTEAALLPLLDQILRGRPEKISLLYITPLRALNRDMLRRMTFFAEELGLEVRVRHGDTPPGERARQSRSPPDILITTPETLQILLTGSRLRGQLKNVRWVVVDEVHELANDERGAQLAVGLERLAQVAGRDFQRIGLSATVGSPEEVARFLGGEGRPVEVVRVSVPKGMAIDVEFPRPAPGDEALASKIRVKAEQATALRRCRELIEAHRSTLFFVNTRDTAEFLSSRFRQWSETLPIGVHHGSLSKEVRVQMEEDFKAERLKALICTSSLELGIDVGSADFVLQYNSPREVTRLVQRVGRSGHALGRTSQGTIIAAGEDDLAEAAVIARRALADELEELRVRPNPLSVLANQIVGHVLALGGCRVDECYELFRRAYPFRSLPRATFDDVVKQLNDLGAIRLREGSVYRASRSLSYFYENISMIPDERSYRVVDISTRRSVGILDEAFVAADVQVGAAFIMKGQTWQVVEMGEDHIMVQPVRELGGIPSWVGEEIPVPHAVAREVGRARREGNLEGYPVNPYGRERFEAYLEEQGSLAIPTDELITVEQGRGLLVINACFGSKVNETVGHLLSALLTARLGESIGVHTDPYRVILEVPRLVDPKRVQELLETTDPSAVESILRLALRNSSQLKWMFIQVAKKFGAIRRGVDYREINVGRLMRAFDKTPVLEEALDKMLWERLDVPRTEAVLREIQSRNIRIAISRISHIGKAGVERRRHLVSPGTPDRATLLALKKRLEGENAILFCMNCKTLRTERVGDLRDPIKCPYCGSLMQAALRPYERENAALVIKKRPTEAEAREVRKLYTNASLVRAHRRKAVMALMGRGIGPETAARILRRYHGDELEFLRDILEAEVTYARTKRFWD